MFKFSLSFFNEYIKSDNYDTLNIFNDLTLAHEKFNLIFSADKSIFSVYFIDILKFLTALKLKGKEVDFDIFPKHKSINVSVATWPYIGYGDLKNGIDVSSKIFGKGHLFPQNKLKKSIQATVNSQYFLGKKYCSTVSVVSPKIDKGNNFLWLNARDIKTNLIEFNSDWFSVPQLNDQILLLRQLIFEICAKNSLPISHDVIQDLLESHIRADCSEGEMDVKFDGDFLLLKSGVELQNRMLSLAAVQQGTPVINVTHGEAFGIYDEPMFSKFGEQMFSNIILGYGEQIVANKNTYKFGLKNDLMYVKSNAANAFKYYVPEFHGIKKNFLNIKFYYYPTTLSGSTHRYGPYRDTPDVLYLSWQEYLFKLFGKSITIKLHPKEKYNKSFSFPDVKEVSGSFNDLLKDIDVFVFDYIGTAFNEACATNKPIIYFDLGIRNINIEALKSIKQRTIYFNIEDGIPSKEDISDMLAFKERENTYTSKYSLSGNDESRVQSLSRSIKNYNPL